MIPIIFDMEIYPNRVCLTYLKGDALGKFGEDIKILDGVSEIKRIVTSANFNKYKWIGFNNRYYDHIILRGIREGMSQADVYQLSQDLIVNRDQNKKNPKCMPDWSDNIVDLLEICPKISKCSLKEFGHRLKYPILKNLPYKFDLPLSDSEWAEVKDYSKHDVKITHMLWDKLKSEQESRELLVSMFNISAVGGAPKLAEKCILSKFDEDDRISGFDKGLRIMPNMRLSPTMSEVFKECIQFPNYFKDERPEAMQKEHIVNGLNVQFGLGGIHGCSKPGFYRDCYDYDISSYYPTILINCELGSAKFRKIYKGMYDARLKFKAAGDKKADALKLSVNALYGKLSDQQADEKGGRRLFAPHIALNICLLGQFYIIDFIERLTNIKVLYANTDGVITSGKIPDSIIKEFEERTRFTFECSKVDKLILKDVNSYYAEYANGKIKRKNEFLEKEWTHKPNAPIIQRAVVNKIIHGTELSQTINSSTDPFDFIYFQGLKSTDAGVLHWGSSILEDRRIRFYVSEIGEELSKVVEKPKLTAKRILKLKELETIVDSQNATELDRNNLIKMKATISSLLKPKRTKILKDSKISICMNIADFDWANVVIAFYIKKAEELYEAIMGEQYEN